MKQSLVVISFQFSTFASLMQPTSENYLVKAVVISFQFSTFASLMQLANFKFVVISFQFSTFVSLMQPGASR